MHVTLQDVAQFAGVSAKTVSRVVNNQGEISPATRERVQAAIDQLGYQPNYLARSLVSQRSHTLAVIASGLQYFGPSHILTGIEQQACVQDYSLLFNLIPSPDEAPSRHLLDMLVARRVEGILWAVPEIGGNRDWIGPGTLDHLPPIVFISMARRDDLAIISVDNAMGAQRAVEHLIQTGRRRIGLLNGPMLWWEARERDAGVRRALRQAGLSLESQGLAEGDWSAASGKRGMEAILARAPALDAVFVANDQMALGAYASLLRAGRRIPDDVAVVGFDNTAESSCYLPPLTTIEQRLAEVGQLAVKVLLGEALSGPDGEDEGQPPGMTLLPALIVRESTTGRKAGTQN